MVFMLKICFLCLTRIYVIIFCDGCIILGGFGEHKTELFSCFSVIEGTYVVVNSIAEKFWCFEDELTNALIDEVEICDLPCL